MSKLLGIVNPNADPQDHFAHWLWRATEIPWEYEQLTIEKMDVECGNVQFRVIGPHTPRYPDGVFLKLQINRDLNPEIRTAGQVEAPWVDTPLGTLLTPPNPYSNEPAKPTEAFTGQAPLTPAPDMISPPPPSQKEQLLTQIASMLETLKAMT